MSHPVPGVLADDELDAVRRTFGVAEAQVRRDHVISHTLAAIASIGTDSVVFIGGTALSRTHLPGLRLSEDIDLIAMGRRDIVAGRIERAVTRGLQRSLGTPTFTPALRATHHPDPAALTVAGVTIQVQMLAATGYPGWPSETVPIYQRYSDAPPARLRVLTAPAFAAAKLSAWHDRHAARDLYDMWAMAEADMIDDEAKTLFARSGPLTSASKVSFDLVPTDQSWDSALRHQCIPKVTARQAADTVRAAWNH
jgi:predicted nucleotidyltransferase component of viral defense system